MLRQKILQRGIPLNCGVYLLDAAYYVRFFWKLSINHFLKAEITIMWNIVFYIMYAKILCNKEKKQRLRLQRWEISSSSRGRCCKRARVQNPELYISFIATIPERKMYVGCRLKQAFKRREKKRRCITILLINHFILSHLQSMMFEKINYSR